MPPHLLFLDKVDASVIQDLLILLTAVVQGVGAYLVDLPGTALRVLLDLGNGLIP